MVWVFFSSVLYSSIVIDHLSKTAVRYTVGLPASIYANLYLYLYATLYSIFHVIVCTVCRNKNSFTHLLIYSFTCSHQNYGARHECSCNHIKSCRLYRHFIYKQFRKTAQTFWWYPTNFWWLSFLNI